MDYPQKRMKKIFAFDSIILNVIYFIKTSFILLKRHLIVFYHNKNGQQIAAEELKEGDVIEIRNARALGLPLPYNGRYTVTMRLHRGLQGIEGVSLSYYQTESPESVRSELYSFEELRDAEIILISQKGEGEQLPDSPTNNEQETTNEQQEEANETQQETQAEEPAAEEEQIEEQPNTEETNNTEEEQPNESTANEEETNNNTEEANENTEETANEENTEQNNEEANNEQEQTEDNEQQPQVNE